jgi:hypothetical protein
MMCSRLILFYALCVENKYIVSGLMRLRLDALRAMDMCSNVGQVASHTVLKWRGIYNNNTRRGARAPRAQNT